jgi:hypothetical protein
MVAVVLERGRAWDRGCSLADQAGFAEHAAFVTELLDREVAIAAGPFADPSVLQNDDDLVALALLKVGSVAEGERLFASDPIVVGEVMSASVYSWGNCKKHGDTDPRARV